MTQYRMFSPEALSKFKDFCRVANLTAPHPEGAFDQALPKTQPRKESTMSKFRYVPIKGTANSLFTRERSNVMAYDDATGGPNEIASKILEFLGGKISDDDLRQVKELLMIEAGEELPKMKEARKLAEASQSRAGAQDSAIDSFNKMFPGAARIGRDDMIGRR